MGWSPARGRSRPLARTLGAARFGAQVLTTLLVTSFVVYAAMDLAPGNRASVLFGNKRPDVQVRAEVAAHYGLDRGLLEGYAHWLGSALHGDFGLSLATHTSVQGRIVAGLPTSLYLVVLAALLTTLTGIALGLAAGLRRGTTDAAVMAMTALGIATPTFVTATVLLALFGSTLGWFPTFGAGEGLSGRLHHLFLPAVTLAFMSSAFVARVMRAAIRTELHADHVETARSRGLRGWRLTRRHIVRNAMLPITTVVGLQIASLIAGTIVVEQAFGLNGLGQLLVTAVNQKDVPTVQAVCLIMVTAFVLTSSIVDAGYRFLDPRIRHVEAAP